MPGTNRPFGGPPRRPPDFPGGLGGGLNYDTDRCRPRPHFDPRSDFPLYEPFRSRPTDAGYPPYASGGLGNDPGVGDIPIRTSAGDFVGEGDYPQYQTTAGPSFRPGMPTRASSYGGGGQAGAGAFQPEAKLTQDREAERNRHEPDLGSKALKRDL